jgi:integrase/recombinase XerD
MGNAIARYEQQGLELAARQFDTSILAGIKSPNTIEQYRMHFAGYCAYAGGWSAACQPATLALWRQHLYEKGYTTASGEPRDYSVAAINQRLAAVRGVMAAASEQGYITHELAEQFKAVKGLAVKVNKHRKNAHARTPISKADMQRMIDAPDTQTLAGTMHRALLLTLATCGMRISEAVGLKVADLQFVETDDRKGWAAYVLGKNMDAPEGRALGKQAKAAIDQWLAVRANAGIRSDYIFTGFGGRGDRDPQVMPITRQAAWQLVRRYAEAVGLTHVKPHDFRRFVGTQLAKKDIRIAQKQLGHKRIETTAQHYVLDDVPIGVTDDLL